MSEEIAESVDLELATLDQIADELARRYDAVVIAVHRTGLGTMMSNCGDMTICLGAYRELGWWLKQKWDEVECRDPTADE
jgi:hypothetical protein